MVMRIDMATMALPLAQHVQKTASTAIERVPDIEKWPKKLAAVLALPTLFPVFLISRDLRALVGTLRTEPLDHLGALELRPLAHQLCQAYGRLRKLLSLYDQVGLSGNLIYRNFLGAIADSTDRLESIVEGLYMSFDTEFCEILQDAAEIIAVGSPRRSVVGEMQD